MRQSAEIKSQINADKFYPPQVDTPQFLCRKRILDKLLIQKCSNPRSLLIEAQAGQGKTTVIKQFLNRLETASVWYQVGPEDCDPSFFIQGIAAGLNTCLPDFPSSATAKVLTESGFSVLDLKKRTEVLLNDLSAGMKQDVYIVFDDLHYLIRHESSLFVLNYLLEKAPPKLHFVLSSREPLPLGNRNAHGKQDLLRLDCRDLSLDENEIIDLLKQVLKIDVSHNVIQEIARETDGWIMGVLLLGQKIRQDGNASVFSFFPGRREGGREILDYFREEIFIPLEPRLHRPLLILSLLDEIPVDLAIELTGEPQIGDDLRDLARRNLFVRQLDPENREFCLHHLFRQFLQEKAFVEFGAETAREIHQQAGWFRARRQGDLAQALRYMLRAEAYDAVETILEDHGMSFLAINRTATLAAILNQIPEASLRRQGWSSFYLAAASMDLAPALALPLLDQALNVFTTRQDEVGELLCLAHIISIHITTSGDYRQEKTRLLRAEQLFHQTTDALEAPMAILVARSLAMGHGIFMGNFEEASRYATFALSLAREKGMVNFESALLMVLGYIQIYAGQTSAARMYMEQAASYVDRPEVGTFNSLVLRMMLLNFLFQEGDFFSYFDQKNQIIDTVGNTVFAQSVAGPLCCVLEMDILLFQGRFEDALNLAEQILIQHPSLDSHLRSQILQFKALALALLHRPGEAMPAAEDSHRLREISGRVYSVIVNKLMFGLTCFHCDRNDDAINLLTEGIQGARQMPTEYLEACGLLHRAAVHLAAGEESAAALDIERALGLMRRNRYRHLWGWTAKAMEKVLSFAVAHGIEPDYARLLAAERLDLALQDDESAIPLLNIRTLGSFQILRHGVAMLQAEDLTPQQRELLCLLISAPHQKLAQETVQLYLWPESSRETANIKLDTLLSRLRKKLSDALSRDADIYLKRQKGMLWLTHCRIDALDFLAAADRGLHNVRLQEYWQAGNAFTLTQSLWQGEFAPGVSGEDQIRNFRENLTRALTESASSWSGLLAGSGRLPQAIRVVEKALDHDPLNDLLYTLLYRLQGQRSAVSAQKVLKRFTVAFQREGYSADEIDELAASITMGPASVSAATASF